MGKLWHSFRLGSKTTAFVRPPSPRLNLEQLEDRCLLAANGLSSVLPDVTYHGGPLLENVQIENVYYGQAWSTDTTLQQSITQTDAFLQYFVTSPYMDVLKQYNVGDGTFLNQDDILAQNPSGSTLDDSQIRQLLGSEIGAGHVVAPTADQLYLFYTAPGVTVTANGQNSNSDFAGYHDVFTDTTGAAVYYAVLPYPTGGISNVQLTTFQQETFALSHEVSESITDPDTQAGWFDPRYGEIADIANGQFGTLNGYVVTGVWSQSAQQVVIPSAATSGTTTSTGSSAALQISGSTVDAVAGQQFTSIVATITGAPATATTSSYTATIDWGNGTTSTGTLANDPNGGFDIAGTNTYAQAGSFAITVTVDDATGAVAGTVLTQAHVAAAAPTVQATGTLLSITGGQQFSGSVATFTDSSATAALGNYTATINWGDGTTSAGTIVAGANGGFVVNGSHTYSAVNPLEHSLLFGNAGFFGSSLTANGAQYFVVSVMIDDTPTNSTTTALSLATVTPPPPVITADGDNIVDTSGQSFTGTVATFTDTVAGATASDFTATINWGDGTTSAGTVAAGSNGGFVVTGTHTYSMATDWFGFWFDGSRGEQRYVLSVSITDTTTQDQASTAGLATVYTTAPNLSVLAQNISATLGQQFSGIVATFTDTNAALTAASFTATIDWGDGTTSAGTISAAANGGFVVMGTHTYTNASNPDSIWGGPQFDFGQGVSPFGNGGQLPVSVTVQSNTTDHGVSQAQATISAAAANVQATGTLIETVLGTSFSGTVATFTTPLNVASLTATIDWGDGTTSTGSIQGGEITGTHTYGVNANGGPGAFYSGRGTGGAAGPQAFLVTVTIQNTADSSTATAVSLASVTTAPPSLVANAVNLHVTPGTAFSATVATFTDTGATASSDTVTIFWGDGTRSTGTVSANPNGGYLVGGTHTYVHNGVYVVFVTIRDADGDRAVSLGTATVSNSPTAPAGSLTSVALGILQSVEHDTDLVLQDYQLFLGRMPSSAETAWWVNFLQQGNTENQLTAGFLSSPEFYNKSGANNTVWLDALYSKVLGRNADAAGQTYWLQQLADGSSLSAIALGFVASPEMESHIVQSYYQQYLGRAAATSEVAYWVNQFENGDTNNQIVAGFLGSPEYYQQQNANPSAWLTSTYQQLLSRAPDPNGMNYWLAELGD